MLSLIPPTSDQQLLLFCSTDNDSDGSHRNFNFSKDNFTTTFSTYSSKTLPPFKTEQGKHLSSASLFNSSPDVRFSDKSTSPATRHASVKHTTTTNFMREDKFIEGDKADEEELNKLLKEIGLSIDQIKNMSEDAIKNLLLDAVNNQTNSGDERMRSKRDLGGRDQSLMGHIRETLSGIQLGTGSTRVLILVIIIVVIGEFFSSPADTIADNVWFDFLNGLDLLQRYGQHRMWGFLGVIFLPLIVAVIVENTPCILNHGVHHFAIHFYVFAIVAVVLLLWSLFYPIHASVIKIQSKQKILKGLRILCSDVHGISLTLTALITGLLYAPLNIYCFWMVQDAGGNEIIMGAAVMASALGDLSLHSCHKWIVKKIGHAGAVVLAMTIMATRLLSYSFMWSPWIIVPGDAFQSLSYTLMWSAVQSYPDFKVNPFVMDRSAHVVLMNLHNGVGFAGGAVLGGWLYHEIGVSRLYQAAAMGAFTWALLFYVVHRCFRAKPKVHYTKLLEADNDGNCSDDDSLSWSDDWLEVAMKSAN